VWCADCEGVAGCVGVVGCACCVGIVGCAGCGGIVGCAGCGGVVGCTGMLGEGSLFKNRCRIVEESVGRYGMGEIVDSSITSAS
jgi:hypothetical protein